MFAAGLIGFLAAVIFQKTKKRPLFIAVYGFFAVLIIYGGIMNPYYLLFFSPQNATLGAVLTSYAAGLPFDLIHAAATVIFILLLCGPIMKKFNRLKKKY